MEIDERKILDCIDYLQNCDREELGPEHDEPCDLPVIENVRSFIEALRWVVGFAR